MNRIEALIFMTIISTIKSVTGQDPPPTCYCYPAASSQQICMLQGCSLVTNPHCDTGDYFTSNGGVMIYPDVAGGSFAGCNCPKTPYNLRNNGYASAHFNYSTCTEFGANVRHDLINIATDCCNFCCDRNDPYPPNAGDRRSILNKSLFFSGLMMLILIGLNIS